MRKKTTCLIFFTPCDMEIKKVLRKTLAALLILLAPVFAFAQQKISGKVTAQEDGSALPGVSVRIKDSNTGTQTDAKGNYSITASQGQVLVFTFVGYTTHEVPVTGASTYNVSLQFTRTALTEIVVTGQGVKREKRSLGYAVATINKEDIGDNVSPINALTGKVAGLNITSGYAPGASSRITLRGPTSFNGSNQPVFIIDGIPVSNDNIRNSDFLNDQVDYGNRGNDLNPNDIESITVLKGPAAAALYGSQASNGAILITTKKGKKNSSAQINFSTSYQLSNILKYPTFQNEFGQGDLDRIADDRRENFSWGQPFDGKLRPFGQLINGKQQLKEYKAIPNNVKDFFDPGQTFNNNLTVSGGNEKSTYFLSLGALNNMGVMPTTNYNKYSVRFSGSSEFSEKFSSSVSVGYTNIASKLPLAGQTNSVYNSIFQQPRDMPIVDFKDLSNPYYGTFKGADGTDYYGYYGAYTKNPYFLLQNYKNTNSVDRVNGTFSLSYKPVKGLDITERVGADIYADRRYEQGAKYFYQPFEVPFYAGNNWSDNGKYSQDVTNYSQFNHDLIVTYTTAIAKDLNMKVLAGNNVRILSSNNLFSATNQSGGLIVPGFYALDNSNGPIFSNNTVTKRRLYAFYGEADFDYKNMLFLGVTGRNDVSSTLPVNNRSYFYPSVNGAFVFSELYKDKAFSDVLSFGKIRASYAKVGQDADPYLWNTTYDKATISGDFGQILFPISVNNSSVPGFTRRNLIGNPNIKPEFTSSFEVGAELSFIKNILNVDVTYYSTKSTNQIVNVPIPNSSGFNNITLNVGEMTNKGLELGLRATPVNTSYGLKVEVFGTYNKVNNKVVSINQDLQQIVIGNGTTAMSQVAAVGKPYGTFYGTGLAIDPTTGKTVIDPETGMPLNNATRYYGTYLPDYMASLGANISYKGFMLKVLFDTKQGGQFYSNTKSLIDFGGYAVETATNGRKDYVFPNSGYYDAGGKFVDNTSIKFHPETYWTRIVPAGEHLIDASYVKLREASLTYSFAQSMLKRTPFSRLNVVLYGNNLFLWVPKSNKFADPEINGQGAANVQGYEFLSNPSLRNMGIKVDVSF